MRIRARLVGLLATLLLVGVLVAVPALLVRVGADVIPSGLPDLDQFWTALRAPDDGSLVLRAVTIVAWLAWAVLSVTIVVEVVARLRGFGAPRLPGLRVPQLAARQIVSAAALLFVAVPTGALTATVAAPAQAVVAQRVLTDPSTPIEAPAPTQAADPVASSPTYTVRPGDSLSTIARDHLGDVERWPELVTLNPAVADHPDLIYPGTVLTLPTEPPVATDARTYTVRPGDTLSAIAARELGDADRYPEIFAASTSTVQADGRRITDPDVIDVGQVLTVPGASAQAVRDETAPDAPEDAVAIEAPTPAPPPTPPTEPTPTSDAPTPAPTSDAVASPTPPQIPAGAAQVDAPEADEEDGAIAPAWLLAGLTGGGAVLAGSMFLLRARRRHARSRARLPGRTMAPPPTVLAPVDKTITAVGAVTAPTLEHLDAALRRMAAAVARDGSTMPALIAVELTATDVVLHLAAPAALGSPWQTTAGPRRWFTAAGVPLDEIGPEVPDQPAPYPLLVTVGLGDDDAVWLLNLEDHVVSLTGDPVFALDLARYVVAEIACNPWSAGAQVECVGLGDELAGLNPDRVRVHANADTGDDDPIREVLVEAKRALGNADSVDADVATARAAQLGADAWTPRLVLLDAATENPALEDLLYLVRLHPGRTATCVLLSGHAVGRTGLALDVTADGRIAIPTLGLDLIAVGLTSDEAQGCADLLAQAEDVEPTPVPVDTEETDGWRSFVNQAGALRDELALPRDEVPPAGVGEASEEPRASSLLPEPDERYLEVSATTAEDLAALAPRVPDAVRVDLEGADPNLDRDLAAWFDESSRLPKLRLLGPVRATTRGKPLVKRKPYMTELLTFIALHPHGATPAEVAEAFGLTTAKVREYVRLVREWLGTNPRTHEPHLPDARLAAGSLYRGTPVYEVVDLLIDLDLFKRLRARGQARGADGINDLRTALRLVDGRPFDAPVQRRVGGGWTWLIDGERLDEYAAIGIVDVAHIVVNHALAAGDTPAARMAAETAAMAARHEEIPRLDLAAVANAEGNGAEAARILRDEVVNRVDDGVLTGDPGTRSVEIFQGATERRATRAS